MSDPLAATRCLANLPPIAPRWLWNQRLPKGKIVLLAGPSGSGKTFIALDLAARITTATPLPPNSPGLARGTPTTAITAITAPTAITESTAPASVLLITPEEDLIDNIRPRLEAAHANVDKITATTELPLEKLKSTIDQIDDLKLIIIDPLSFLVTNDAEPLAATRKLFQLYQHVFGRSITILALLPMRPGHRDPLHRIPGIVGLAPYASTIFVASPDHREENTQTNRRVLIQLKNNLSPLAPPLAFNIENSAITWSDEPFPTENLDAIISPPRQKISPDPLTLDNCTQWLYEVLAPKPLPQSQIAQAAAAAGFSYRTLRRAKDALKVQSKREKEGHWIWRVHPGILDYDNFDQLTDKILREAQLPGLNPTPPK